MKTSALLASLALVLSSLSHAQLASEFTFNRTEPALEFRNRARLGEPGSGVSGKPDDRAYLGPVSLPPANVRGGPVLVSRRPLLAESVDAFTLTFWYRLEMDQPDLVVPFNSAAIQFLFAERGPELRIENSSENPRFLQFQISPEGPYASWRTPHVWIFCAITWDRETNTATFYQGTDRQPALLARSMSRSVPTNATLPRLDLARNPEVIGNHHADIAERPLPGRLDNLRFFTAVLDPRALETIRRADVANTPPSL